MSNTKEETKVADPTLAELLASSDVWGPHTLTYFGPEAFSIIAAGEIDTELSISLCSQILELASKDQTLPITLYINSHGGGIVDALAIYDCLRMVPNPITTVVIGGCYSAGLILLCAGDVRTAAPHSFFFHHQPILTAGEIPSGESLDGLHTVYKWSKNTIDRLFLERTGMKREVYEQHFKTHTSKYFGAYEAVQYGFINQVISYTSKGTDK